MDKIGARIEFIRKTIGQNQVKMADNLNVTQSKLSNAETGSSKRAQTEIIEKLGDIYKINKGWLYTGDGDPWPDGAPDSIDIKQIPPIRKEADNKDAVIKALRGEVETLRKLVTLLERENKQLKEKTNK